MKTVFAFFSALLMPTLQMSALDGFDYPFGPPDGTPRCPGVAQCSGGWQNVQGFRVNNHLGEDWNFGSGSDDLGMPIYAAGDGEVVYAQEAGTDGSWRGIIIIHHSGAGLRVPGRGVVQEVTTLYGHLEPGRINEWVSVGARVARGQQIGVIGPTPVGSSGPHLHFEVRTNVNIGVVPGYGSDATGWVSPSEFVNLNRAFGLQINAAVHLTWVTATNRAYQVLAASTVDGPYSSVGDLTEGTGGQVGWFAAATNEQRFFKVQETAASGMSWLEGVWQGVISQVTTNVTNHFTARFSISNSNRVFEWTSSRGPCTHLLSLLSYSDTYARFNSYTQTGACVDSTVILSRIDQTNLACAIYAIGVGGAGGLLIKQ